MSARSSASRRRSAISLLAGGGLTAAALGGLGAPLSGGALAAEATTGTTTTSPPPVSGTTTTPAESAPGTGTSTAATTTSTTPVAPAPTTTTQTGTATTPSPTVTAGADKSGAGIGGSGKKSSGSSGSGSTGGSYARTHGAPRATVQHSQQTTTTPVVTTGGTSAQAPPPTPPAATGTVPPQSSAAIAPAPQLAAIQSSALAAMTSGSSASLQALGFYRIPPFLLPIYQAAAVQYGVPWPILAAINEVETDFGTDLSVSSAGAVGWMQFMPETWLQYGVDALNAGYADPYNPVDAIFAAARYLHAAGASTNLRAAILAYNHSEAYVESVLLRARLFASYPGSAIATLTGLTEGALPAPDARVAPGSTIPTPKAPSPAGPGVPEATVPPGGGAASATGAGATGSGAAGAAAGGADAADASATAGSGSTAPGSANAPGPRASAAKAERALDAAAPPKQLSTLMARKNAPVVAVEDGRIVGIGVSRKLGRYVVLRDTYGDVFTYASLGATSSAYHVTPPEQLQVPKGALSSGEAGAESTPTQAASAGSQTPLTLHVAARQPSAPAVTSGSSEAATGEAQAAGGKVRVFAHPGNPDARLAASRRAAAGSSSHEQTLAAGWAVLARGARVAQGTVLGHVSSSSGEGPDASLRFAIRPAGAQSAVDPRPILENWRQLSTALHPRGAKARGEVLAGATAADAFALSHAELERAVLADPGIQMGACDRSQVAAGKVNPHALSLLVFLSRSGLKPTVGRMRCGTVVQAGRGPEVVFPAPGTLDIAAINGVPIADHQGAGTVTDITIRTLLTISPHRDAPSRIVSLMSYPGSPSTVAAGDHASFIGLELSARSRPAARQMASSGSAATVAGTGTGQGAGGPSVARAADTTNKTSSQPAAPASLSLDTLEWQHLIGQIGSIQQPRLASSPSASAIRDARP